MAQTLLDKTIQQGGCEKKTDSIFLREARLQDIEHTKIKKKRWCQWFKTGR